MLVGDRAWMHASASNTFAQRQRILDEAKATLDRLCAIEPRAVSIDVPEGLERWKAEAREFERKRRAATRRRRQQERQEIEMARRTQQASGDDYWAAVDARIGQVVSANYEHNRKVMVQVIAELEHIFEKRFRAIETSLRAIETANGEVVSRVTALSNGGPDGNGIVRKQSITPH